MAEKNWTEQEKVSAVQIVLGGFASLKQTAVANGIPNAVLRSWVRLYRSGALGGNRQVTLDLWLDESWILEIERRIQQTDPAQAGPCSVRDWVVSLLATELNLPQPSKADPAFRPPKMILPAECPGDEPKRWTPRRKLVLVQALLDDQLSFEEACERYGIDPGDLRNWLARNRQLERARCRIELDPKWFARMEPRWRREDINTSQDAQAAAEWVRRLIRKRLSRGR